MRVVYPGPNVAEHVRRDSFQSMRHPGVVIPPSIPGEEEKPTEVPDDIAQALLEAGTVRLPAAEQAAAEAAAAQAQKDAKAAADAAEKDAARAAKAGKAGKGGEGVAQ